MSSVRHPSASALGLMLGVLIGLVACASEPKTASAKAAPKPTNTHAEISNELTATAQVVSLDKNLRLVTLRGEDGRLSEIYAGSDVRNFEQIAVGDALRVRYRQALSATLLPPGSDPQLSEGSFGAVRSVPGAKPGGSVGAQFSLRVKIYSLDADREVVVFAMPSGELIAHRIATPQGREFVKSLKVGDLVQLDYSEALALSIETVKPVG